MTKFERFLLINSKIDAHGYIWNGFRIKPTKKGWRVTYGGKLVGKEMVDKLNL